MSNALALVLADGTSVRAVTKHTGRESYGTEAKGREVSRHIHNPTLLFFGLPLGALGYTGGFRLSYHCHSRLRPEPGFPEAPSLCASRLACAAEANSLETGKVGIKQKSLFLGRPGGSGG